MHSDTDDGQTERQTDLIIMYISLMKKQTKRCHTRNNTVK